MKFDERRLIKIGVHVLENVQAKMRLSVKLFERTICARICSLKHFKIRFQIDQTNFVVHG